MMHGEPTHELMLDPRQPESPFFSHGSHSFDDLRNHMAPPTMVRYLAPQFAAECSEPDEAMEAVDAQEIQHVSWFSFFVSSIAQFPSQRRPSDCSTILSSSCLTCFDRFFVGI